MAFLLPSAGDYELQVGITEALFRFTNQSDRKTFAKSWFKNKSHSEEFANIRDSEFETVSKIIYGTKIIVFIIKHKKK